MAIHCLIVEDDLRMQRFLSRVLAGAGISSTVCSHAAAIVAVIASQKPDLIFLDIALDGSDAIETFRSLETLGFDGPVQLVSGCASNILHTVHRSGKDHGLCMLPPLSKPFKTAALRRILESQGLIGAEASPIRLDGEDSETLVETRFWCRPWLPLQDGGSLHIQVYPDGATPSAVRAVAEACTEGDHLALFQSCLGSTAKVRDLIRTGNASAAITLPSQLGSWKAINIPSVFERKSDHPVFPELMVLEFTEDDLLENVAVARDIIVQMQIRGVRSRVVDAGARFLSVAGFDALPVQEIVVSPTLLKVFLNGRSEGAFSTVVDIARRAGAAVLAGPLGAPAERDILRRAGFARYNGDGLPGWPRPLDPLADRLAGRSPSQRARLWDMLPDFSEMGTREARAS